MTTPSEFSASVESPGGKYEMPFFIVCVLFLVGMLFFNAYLLTFPHIYGNLNNLSGIAGLGVVALLLLAYFLRQAWRLGFEVSNATVKGSNLKVAYRFLGEKELRLPYAGRVKRGVRLIDFRNGKGYRFVSVISRGLLDRVTVPADMPRSEELVQLLGRT